MQRRDFVQYIPPHLSISVDRLPSSVTQLLPNICNKCCSTIYSSQEVEAVYNGRITLTEVILVCLAFQCCIQLSPVSPPTILKHLKLYVSFIAFLERENFFNDSHPLISKPVNSGVDAYICFIWSCDRIKSIMFFEMRSNQNYSSAVSSSLLTFI